MQIYDFYYYCYAKLGHVILISGSNFFFLMVISGSNMRRHTH